MHSVPSHPILTCGDAKAWEHSILRNEAAEWPAMQQAGTGVALAVLDDYREIGGLPPQGRILVLAGKGHNGGDALLAAGSILEKYPQATADVVLCFGEKAMRPLARRALDELRRSGGQRVCARPLADLQECSYDLCLDGIFGFQFRPPMDAAIAQMLAQVNAHPSIRFRAAVDLPSGVGENSAPTAFRADFTYATGIVKQPAVQPANAAAVGRLRYVDLGFFPVERVAPDARDRVLVTDVLTPLANLRAAQSDKRTFGHLFVVGGSQSYPGAVLLAVRAALRSGAGLVTAFVPEMFAAQYALRHPEVMWVGCPLTGTGGLARGAGEMLRARNSRATALLIGPGLAADPETVELAGQLVDEASVPVVLDADALRPEVVVKARNKPFVCTPHAGEYRRIAAESSLREFCGASGAVVVLKGPMTQVAGLASDPTESSEGGPRARPTVYYSTFGGPVLARGGSGDILAGLIGGLLAQSPGEPGLAACRGVVWHGRAADLLARAHGPVAVETSQLLEQLGPALNPTPWQHH